MVQRQVDAVLALDALGATVDVPAQELAGAHATRLGAIQATIGPLLTTIAFLAQRGGLDTDNRWIRAISQLSEMSLRDGSTALNQLTRGPGVLAFHTAGIAACIGQRDNLVGRLLGENIAIEDIRSGDLVPAATVLGPEVMYTSDWPSKALHDFIAPFLAEQTKVGAKTIQRAWERWTFLYHTALECLALHSFSGGHPGSPYLLVVGHRSSGTMTEIGRVIIKEVAQHGDSHDLFAQGMGFVGDAVGFAECAKKLDREYGEQADRMDWQALPSQGGAIPMSRHYPGVR